MKKINRKLYGIYLLILFLPLMILAGACEQTTMPSGLEESVQNENAFMKSPFDLQNSRVNGNVAAQLAEVRRATAKYHRVEVAEADGYINVNVGNCIEHPELGGMGYHFVLPPLVGSKDDLDINQPQALMYEPMKNGKLRLVGVEYITEPGQAGIDPPMLFGQHFHWNPVQGFWALHVWVWRNNPEGMFKDWNPNVSCEHQF